MKKKICLLLPGQGIQRFSLLNNIISSIPEKIKNKNIYKKIIKDLKSKNKSKLNKTSLIQPLIYLYTNYLFEKKKKRNLKIRRFKFHNWKFNRRANSPKNSRLNKRGRRAKYFNKTRRNNGGFF